MTEKGLTVMLECDVHGVSEHRQQRVGRWSGYRCRQCDRDYMNKRRRDLKIKAIGYAGGKCVHCGEEFIDFPEVFDFHHLDPSKKEQPIGTMLAYPWDKVVVEIDKCILLCSNCHRIEHASKKG